MTDSNKEIINGIDYMAYLNAFKQGEIKTPSYAGLTAYQAEGLLNSFYNQYESVEMYSVDKDSDRVLVNLLIQQEDDDIAQMVTYRKLPMVDKSKLKNFNNEDSIILEDCIFLKEG